MLADLVRTWCAPILRRAGNAARNHRRWRIAELAYRFYLVLRPQDADIRIQLGHAMSEAGHFASADRAYRQAASTRPEDGDLLLCWAHSRKRAGDVTAAEALYGLAYGVDGSFDAYRGLRLLASAKKRPPNMGSRASIEVKRFGSVIRGRQCAVVAAHSRTGEIAPQMIEALAVLRREGIATLLIVATASTLDGSHELLCNVDGLLVQEVGGGNLDCWSRATEVYPELYAAATLWLIDGAMLAAAVADDLTTLIGDVRASGAEAIYLGGAASFAQGLVLRRGALDRPLLQRVLRSGRHHLADTSTAVSLFDALIADGVSGTILDVRASPHVEELPVGSGDRLYRGPIAPDPIADRPLDILLIGSRGLPASAPAVWRTLVEALRRSGARLNICLPVGSDIDGPTWIGSCNFSGTPDIALLQLGTPIAALSSGTLQALAAATRRLGLKLNDPELRIPPSYLSLHGIVRFGDPRSTLSSDFSVRDYPILFPQFAEIPGAAQLSAVTARADALFRELLSTPQAPSWPAALKAVRTSETGTPRHELRDVLLEIDGAAGSEAMRQLEELAGFDGWLALSPRGSRLAPKAANSLARHASSAPDVAIFYADDVAATTAESIDRLRLKPEFDLTLLAAQDYVGAPVFIRAKTLTTLGGLDSARKTAVIADLLFRTAARGSVIARIPEVLLVHPGGRVTAQPDDYRAMLSAQPQLAHFRIGNGRATNSFALARDFAESAPEVTLVIPTRRTPTRGGGTSFVERLLHDISSTAWPMAKLQVLVGDDLSETPSWMATPWPFALTRIETARPSDAPFNYAAKMNRLWRSAATEQLVFLNDDIQLPDPQWLQALQTFAVEPTVGGVGARLLFEDGRLQHAGLVPHGDGAAHAWVYRDQSAATYQNWAQVHREWSMVTGAVFATRRSVMELVGGFDEAFALEFNDSDLCLRLRALGFRIVFTPHAEIIHTEKASRGETLPPGEDRARFHMRWAGWLDHDPSWHPRLDRNRIDIAPLDDPNCYY